MDGWVDGCIYLSKRKKEKESKKERKKERKKARMHAVLFFREVHLIEIHRIDIQPYIQRIFISSNKF